MIMIEHVCKNGSLTSSSLLAKNSEIGTVVSLRKVSIDMFVDHLKNSPTLFYKILATEEKQMTWNPCFVYICKLSVQSS